MTLPIYQLKLDLAKIIQLEYNEDLKLYVVKDNYSIEATIIRLEELLDVLNLEADTISESGEAYSSFHVTCDSETGYHNVVDYTFTPHYETLLTRIEKTRREWANLNKII